MELNKHKFEELFREKFKESYAEAGKQLGVSSAQVYRIINNKGSAGAKFLGKLISYCDINKLNFRDYIFLPQLLTVVNKKEIII